jgi:hypothetical protein
LPTRHLIEMINPSETSRIEYWVASALEAVEIGSEVQSYKALEVAAVVCYSRSEDKDS